MSAPSSDYTEDVLIERPAVELFAMLGWKTANLYSEWTGTKSSEGRVTDRDVVLIPRLRAALARLNPRLPESGLAQAIDQAVEELTRDRSKLVRERANQEVYQLLKGGVKVTLPDEQGNTSVETVRLIDWREAANNDFLLASQFWVSSEMYRKRCDLVGFVNGIPLVLFELKASHKTLKSAYDDNLRDYRTAIPQLFTYNAFAVLSNGSKTVMGSTYAPWEHFHEWKRINDEGEQGVVSLETVIRGTCDKARLLDIVENFTVFEETKNGLIKKVAKNHQYLGVNRAIREVGNLGENNGRLGVFWHTQGSGKSLSMVFFTQKIHRTVPGNWTFLIVTDRDELDRQIYKTFAATGAVTEAEAHATSCAHLQQLLTEDHRYVFTLIQKFRTENGATYPTLSERRDIIVITDEAHRSQYDTFALNMRNALPHAGFLGFTGTPLIAKEEERTREVFGDYISVYNFAQSIEDGATVPLYYENRIPELQLTNENLSEDLERLLEDAELDDAQERKVEREFAREYHLITRDDRLEEVSREIVTHFMGRGHRGKAMVICIDKATAVRMYDKVQVHWKAYLGKLKAALPTAPEAEQEMLTARIAEMEAMDMAVVVSQGQNEVEDLAAKGLDITPHRKRMVEEDLDEKFKDTSNPLRLVFVCAMWITGFDVPSCSTLYLDKPMRNHTLMQTIARANRRYPGKQAGLIVDFVGVFRNLQKALAIYGSPTAGEDGDSPIKAKAKLLAFLKGHLVQLTAFCLERGVDCAKIKATPGFQKVALLDDAVEALIAVEEDKKAFVSKVVTACRVYRAILPDAAASEVTQDVVLFSVLAQKIRGLGGDVVDISQVMEQVEDLLDRSVAADPYVMPKGGTTQPLVDLSRIDFDKLREQFDTGRKRTEAEKLRTLISDKLNHMLARNKMRADFMERFQRLIDAYNAGSQTIEVLFAQLIELAQSLKEEDQRAMREGLTEEELAMFDILTKPEPELTEKEKDQVKKVCRELLEKLKAEKLVLDWRNRQQAQAAVRQTVKVVLDHLPRVYTPALYDLKCDLAFRHVYDSYAGAGASVYEVRA